LFFAHRDPEAPLPTRPVTKAANRHARRHPEDPAVRRWASIDDVAVYLDVHHQTVRNWIARGQLTAYRAGDRLIRIDLNEVDALLEAGTA
jgi:excisionase family DNA binding protein